MSVGVRVNECVSLPVCVYVLYVFVSAYSVNTRINKPPIAGTLDSWTPRWIATSTRHRCRVWVRLRVKVRAAECRINWSALPKNKYNCSRTKEWRNRRKGQRRRVDGVDERERDRENETENSSTKSKKSSTLIDSQLVYFIFKCILHQPKWFTPHGPAEREATVACCPLNVACCLLRVPISPCAPWPLQVPTLLFCHNAIKCYLWQIKFTAFRLRLNRLPHKELAYTWHLPESKFLWIPKIVNYCLNWMKYRWMVRAGSIAADDRRNFNDWTCN